MAKVDCETLALKAMEFAGMNPARAPGLAVLFRMVEREAFCDGVRFGRGNSYATDPSRAYDDEYASKAPTATHGKAATKARRKRQASPSAQDGSDGQHREQATSLDAIDPHAGSTGNPATREKPSSSIPSSTDREAPQ